MKTKAKRAVIFGTSSFADVADFYLTHDSVYEVVGFTADSIAGEQRHEHRSRPLFPFAELPTRFPTDAVEVFVAIGYRHMNRLREDAMRRVRERGYRLLSYVSSRAMHWGDADGACRIGENVFVFEGNTLQPFSSIGDGTIFWSGNHLGHHSTVGRCCFVSSQVVISGHCAIGDRTFIGVNATVADAVAVGSEVLVGARALIERDTRDGEVFLERGTPVFPKGSRSFFR